MTYGKEETNEKVEWGSSKTNHPERGAKKSLLAGAGPSQARRLLQRRAGGQAVGGRAEQGCAGWAPSSRKGRSTRPSEA